MEKYSFLLLVHLPSRSDVGLKQPFDVNVTSFIGRSASKNFPENLPENLYILGYNV